MSPNLLDPVILQTDFPDLHLHASGKVRDVYQLDDERLLFVATDRISAFDYVLATGIPHKGRVLTQISLFWFDFLSDIVPNHVITADVESYPQALQKYADSLRGRSMIVQRAEMFPVECVVRGYISGSAWKEYLASGKVCGIDLPPGLRESEAFPEPIFTPATKAVLTPDSSRFWPADKYAPGRSQESYDKQYVRDYLEQIRWNKQPPAPALPAEAASRTSEKYLDAYFQITGHKLDV
jgi:phosphoribosylaminoimidazole-succinocarboxamide synthase